MNTTPTLATRFARSTFVVRSETPLAEDQMRRVGPAQQYRRMLDTLGDDVRAHLSRAARVLADQRPARPSAGRGESRRPAAF